MLLGDQQVMFDSVGLGGRIGGSRRGESFGLPPVEQPISVKAPCTTISETRNHLPTADLVYFQVLGVFIHPHPHSHPSSNLASFPARAIALISCVLSSAHSGLWTPQQSGL